MNGIFFVLIGLGFAVAAARQVAGDSGMMATLSKAIIDDAAGAVTLAISLVGAMTLFLGLMKVGEAGGLLTVIARLLRPALQRLFPEIPAGHPAMGAMIFNIAANALGLGNAATPFGIRAMQRLDELNPMKGTASDAMVLFLAINTSSVTLLPTGVIALRAAAGSSDPAGILPTTLFATLCSTAVAIVLAKLCRRGWPIDPSAVPAVGSADAPHSASAPVALDRPISDEPAEGPAAITEIGPGYPGWVSAVALIAVALLVPLTLAFGDQAAPWIIPGLLLGLLTFGIARRVRVYETFVEGARDGFQVAMRIIPYLVAILVAVGMLRTSGTLDLILEPLSSLTTHLGVPPEALLMGMLRTLSGSGAFAYLASLLADPAVGPDSYTGYLVSTIQGSTETTFYVLAVYFGSVGVRRMRHAVFVGLAADAASLAASVFACKVMVAA